MLLLLEALWFRKAWCAVHECLVHAHKAAAVPCQPASVWLPGTRARSLSHTQTLGRTQVKQDNPGIAFGEIGKVLGAKWKEADADARAEYDEKAAADKQRHASEMAAYKAKSEGVVDADD